MLPHVSPIECIDGTNHITTPTTPQTQTRPCQLQAAQWQPIVATIPSIAHSKHSKLHQFLALSSVRTASQLACRVGLLIYSLIEGNELRLVTPWPTLASQCVPLTKRRKRSLSVRTRHSRLRPQANIRPYTMIQTTLTMNPCHYPVAIHQAISQARA